MQRGKNGGVDSFVIKEWIEHATFLDCYVSHGRPRARFIRGGEKNITFISQITHCCFQQCRNFENGLTLNVLSYCKNFVNGFFKTVDIANNRAE